METRLYATALRDSAIFTGEWAADPEKGVGKRQWGISGWGRRSRTEERNVSFFLRAPEKPNPCFLTKAPPPPKKKKENPFLK